MLGTAGDNSTMDTARLWWSVSYLGACSSTVAGCVGVQAQLSHANSGVCCGSQRAAHSICVPVVVGLVTAVRELCFGAACPWRERTPGPLYACCGLLSGCESVTETCIARVPTVWAGATLRLCERLSVAARSGGI